MGMFDTIHFTCPECNKNIEVHSKSGKCDLENYHQSNVPIEAVSYLVDDEVHCGHCSNIFTIDMPARIALNLILKNANEESYD